jgi:hypothetical protein
MKVATLHSGGLSSNITRFPGRINMVDPINRPKKCTIMNYNNNKSNSSILRTLQFPMGWRD